MQNAVNCATAAEAAAPRIPQPKPNRKIGVSTTFSTAPVIWDIMLSDALPSARTRLFIQTEGMWNKNEITRI